MSPPRILVHAADPAPLVAEIGHHHPDCPVDGCSSYAGLPPLLAERRPEIVFTIRFAGRAGYPRAALLGPHGPRWIANGGSGVDHLTPWDPGAVSVTNVAGVAAHVMAEHVIGTALHFVLGIPGLQRDQAARVWGAPVSGQLHGGTALIVGLGPTGRAVAGLARAFGMRTVGVRARPAPTEGCDAVHGQDALPELWHLADLVAICVPLLPSTRGLVDAAAFAGMKPGAVFVDVSRGGVTDTAALAEALARGHLAGAACDVFPTEPLPPDDPLWGAERLLISPHSSGTFEGYELAAIRRFCENLTRWRAGEPLLNLVDPARGY